MRVLNRLDLAGDVREIVYPFGSTVHLRVAGGARTGMVVRYNVGPDDLFYVVGWGDGQESHHHGIELMPAIDDPGRAA